MAILWLASVGCAAGSRREIEGDLEREGRRLMAIGRPHEALSVLQQSASIHPFSADVRIALGDCYLELGDLLAAHTAYAAAAEGEDGAWRDPEVTLTYRNPVPKADAAGLPEASGRKFLSGILLGVAFLESTHPPRWSLRKVDRDHASDTIRLMAYLSEAQELSPGIRCLLGDDGIVPGKRRTIATANHPLTYWIDPFWGDGMSKWFDAATLGNPPFGSMAGADLDLAAGDCAAAREQYTGIIAAARAAGIADNSFLMRHVTGAALHKRGMAYGAQGNWTAARGDFEEAAKCRPGDAEVLTDLGFALLETASATEAKAMFDQALAIEPGLEAARVGLVRTSAARGK